LRHDALLSELATEGYHFVETDTYPLFSIFFTDIRLATDTDTVIQILHTVMYLLMY